MKLLVTTAIEQTWGNDEPIVFLGEWCRRYERKEVWQKRPHRLVTNHWDDRQKLKHDYAYLKSLYESLLQALAEALNRYHQIERSLRYWRMILGPWLLTYVAVIFDRWEYLRQAIEGYSKFETVELVTNAKCKPPFDYENFMEAIQTDIWNHRTFLEIIKSNYSDQCKFNQFICSHNTGFKESNDLVAKIRPKSQKIKIAEFLDSALDKLTSKDQTVFYESYFPLFSLVRLNLRLGQLPRLHLKEFEWPIRLPDSSALDTPSINRKSISLLIEARNIFEKFLINKITKDIPSAYVELFPALLAKANGLSIRPSIILTAGAHWHNELFKIWAAEQVVRGCKFVAMQHGGSLASGSLSAFDFEEDISDVYATWGVQCHPKHVKLPPSKLVPLKRTAPGGRYCSLIGLEMPRYSFRIQVNPISNQVLEHYTQALELYEHISPLIQHDFRVKPYVEQGWNFRQRFIDTIGPNKIYGELDYSDVLSLSRIVVCTYPETTFAEAMASGLPTILLYPDKFWELNQSMYPLLELLKSVKIIFHDPKGAAEHLNNIWDNPDQWWNSPVVVSARLEFHRQVCNLDKNWLKKWANFIKSLNA